MRTAAIIIAGLAISMGLDGEYVALPFWLAVALALEFKHRARARRPSSLSDARTDRIPLVGPRKRGRHG